MFKLGFNSKQFQSQVLWLKQYVILPQRQDEREAMLLSSGEEKGGVLWKEKTSIYNSM